MMNSIAISLIVFACIFGGALFGIFLRAALPEHHLSGDSKDLVKLSMGMVITMTALVLGLLVASAKDLYDTLGSELVEMSAGVVLLDRALAHYGPETRDARSVLRESVVLGIERLWPKDGLAPSTLDPKAAEGEVTYDKIQQLSPQNDAQRLLKDQALGMVIDLGRTRWLMFARKSSSISVPLLVVMVCWLTAIFIGFGIFAPRNRTVFVALCICALSVSGAIFLILEMYSPFEGVIQLSSAPLRNALAHLGQ